MTHIAFLLYCILLHRTQSVPIVQAAEPVSIVPWRLFTVCTPNRTNVPLAKEHEA